MELHCLLELLHHCLRLLNVIYIQNGLSLDVATLGGLDGLRECETNGKIEGICLLQEGLVLHHAWECPSHQSHHWVEAASHHSTLTAHDHWIESARIPLIMLRHVLLHASTHIDRHGISEGPSARHEWASTHSATVTHGRRLHHWGTTVAVTLGYFRWSLS